MCQQNIALSQLSREVVGDHIDFHFELLCYRVVYILTQLSILVKKAFNVGALARLRHVTHHHADLLSRRRCPTTGYIFHGH